MAREKHVLSYLYYDTTTCSRPPPPPPETTLTLCLSYLQLVPLLNKVRGANVPVSCIAHLVVGEA